MIRLSTLYYGFTKANANDIEQRQDEFKRR